ncbi:hypothetical protein MJO28_000640 [Puccinia striiformis f. sp. tritici]|uniref:Uncharacterized protein n=2 Tax=Puccinia striiformis TaxID=27350 RepID=A0A2S4USY8_9BASI|nr:hypothetical protein MJO28_000640 [Puccinia striiformis f. sp. tritici]POW00348.1 hypothetical protein PSHT_13085 [Puccinia striiformis]
MADSPRTNADKLRHQRQCWHYGDLVDYGFKRLRTKYHFRTADQPDPESIEHALSALSIDKAKSQEALAHQLLSSLLPLLHSQITSLSLVLKTSSLRREPGPKLSLVLQIQGQLDSTMDELRYLIATLCPENPSLPDRADDQHLRRFKSYRLDRLNNEFRSLFSWGMCDLFQAANERIGQMELTSIPSIHDEDADTRKKDVEWSVSYALNRIKAMSDSLSTSELAAAQVYWELDRPDIDNLLNNIIKKLNPSTDSRKVEGRPTLPRPYIGEPVIRLAKLTLPIVKLSRIFLAKLSKRGLAQERFPIFTEICSDQIQTLAECARDIARDLRKLESRLDFADDGGVTSDDFTTTAKSLKTRFDAPLLLVLVYFIPLIPDDDGLNVQNYYKNWCMTWLNQMALAIHNFEHAAESFEGTP